MVAGGSVGMAGSWRITLESTQPGGAVAIAYPVAMHLPGHLQAQPRHALVFGGSGQIGERLMASLHAAGWQVQAFSRGEQRPLPGVQWRRGDLAQPWAQPAHFEAIFSCGPLDHFARWYAQSPIEAAHVVAFGSTSVDVKQDSAEEAERDVAGRLRQAEALLFATASARTTAATVLRPTLVYGAGRDKTLTAIAALAQRSGFFVLPASANGLRQPVHVQDLADAALAVIGQPAAAGQAYAVGGGEVLAYSEMVRRTLAALPARPRLLQVPGGLFKAAVRVAHLGGRLRGLNDAVIHRMGQPLVFDLEPARRDFGYAPRPFQPQAEMFTAPALPAQ